MIKSHAHLPHVRVVKLLGIEVLNYTEIQLQVDFRELVKNPPYGLEIYNWWVIYLHRN